MNTAPLSGTWRQCWGCKSLLYVPGGRAHEVFCHVCQDASIRDEIARRILRQAGLIDE